MDAMVLLDFQPIEAIRMYQSGPAESNWFLPLYNLADFALHPAEIFARGAINPAIFSNKEIRAIQAQIRPTEDVGVGPITLDTLSSICLTERDSDVNLNTWRIASRTRPGAYLACSSLMGKI